MYVLVTKYNHTGQHLRQLNLTTPPPPPPTEKNIRLMDVLEHKKDKMKNISKISSLCTSTLFWVQIEYFYVQE